MRAAMDMPRCAVRTRYIAAFAAFALIGACQPAADEAAPPSANLIRAAQAPTVLMDAELRGRLDIEADCFVVRHAAGRHTIIWPLDARVTREGQEILVQSASTESSAQVGANVALNGGETSGLDAAHVEGGVLGGSEACAPPYWVAQAFRRT